MAEYKVSFYMATRYEGVVVADSEEDALNEAYAQNWKNGLTAVYFDDEGYDWDIENADDMVAEEVE